MKSWLQEKLGLKIPLEISSLFSVFGGYEDRLPTSFVQGVFYALFTHVLLYSNIFNE